MIEKKWCGTLPASGSFKIVVAISILFAAFYSSAASPKISGTVTDLNGNPISNSRVVVENNATHHSISVLTDGHGRFVVRNLKGSDYSVFVVADSAKDGFRLQLDHSGSARMRDHVGNKAVAHRRLLPSQMAIRGH